MRLGQTQKLWDHWFFIGAWGYSPAAIDSRNRFAYISDLVDVFVSWKNKASKEKGKINLHVYIHDLYNLHVTIFLIIFPDYCYFWTYLTHRHGFSIIDFEQVF